MINIILTVVISHTYSTTITNHNDTNKNIYNNKNNINESKNTIDNNEKNNNSTSKQTTANISTNTFLVLAYNIPSSERTKFFRFQAFFEL